MCGEHASCRFASVLTPGSSPRVRGTPSPDNFPASDFGIIPACAGNTWARPCSGRVSWDHPRVCGEHTVSVLSPDGNTGSSPRVRGTHKTAIDAGWMDGIIPACAGNTRLFQDRRPLLWDHPRVCGEHFDGVEAGGYVRGSSPRVRGTPRGYRRCVRWHGIIPACAGNTKASVRRRQAAQDHPRVCGEHLRLALMSSRLTGSSPRVRGTHGAADHPGAVAGIIPACAGNTAPTPTWSRRPRDHPRVCGEHI